MQVNFILASKFLILQKFESELAMRVELAVTNERGKWEEENKRVWQQQQDRLLTTAHQEWSKAQESITRAELERARKEWERETEKNTQVVAKPDHCTFTEKVRREVGKVRD